MSQAGVSAYDSKCARIFDGPAAAETQFRLRPRHVLRELVLAASEDAGEPRPHPLSLRRDGALGGVG